MRLLILMTILVPFLKGSNCMVDEQVLQKSLGDQQCEACNKWSNFIWNLTTQIDSKVVSSIKKLCLEYSTLPEDQNEAYCNKTIDRLLQFLLERWNKDQICEDIGACPPSKHIRDSNTYVNGPEDCKYCIYVNKQIKELIVGGPTEIEFKRHIEFACRYLGDFKNECLQMVDQYIDILFDFLRANYDPVKFCSSLKVCSTQTKNVDQVFLPSANELLNILPVDFPAPKSDPIRSRSKDDCMLCKKLVDIIHDALQNNDTVEQIVNVLEEVCRILPSSKRSKCENIIANYAHQLIQILTQDIDSDTACILVGLCSNNPTINPISKRNSFCLECELIAHFIQNEIYSYNNEEQIEQFIKHHLCNRLSFVVQPTNCQAFIDQYGAMIMQTIAQEVFNPDVLCFKELKLCKRAKIHVIQPEEKNKCDLCQSIVENLSNITQNELILSSLASNVCSKKNMSTLECLKFLDDFGGSLVDSLDRYDSAKLICESIDICLNTKKVHLLGGHKCTFGPSYWCHSVSHANACKAFKYCHEKIWSPN
ncbi:Prosaposin [Sarcoptes scabiei]|uniref:Prosaposin n=1 Tax=Sarcoptes scabiei TaxID=52283 RepID=A0A834VDY2_SARSC|nr:Prosaposin [Sarcoptes scabiei]